MDALDRRIGELMVRLRLSRRAATRQALDEAATRPAPVRTVRKSDYHLTA